MARTRRNIPKQAQRVKWLRTPRYRWKLKAGLSPKVIVTDRDDKLIAARRETIDLAKLRSGYF